MELVTCLPQRHAWLQLLASCHILLGNEDLSIVLQLERMIYSSFRFLARPASQQPLGFLVSPCILPNLAIPPLPVLRSLFQQQLPQIHHSSLSLSQATDPAFLPAPSHHFARQSAALHALPLGTGRRHPSLGRGSSARPPGHCRDRRPDRDAEAAPGSFPALHGLSKLRIRSCDTNEPHRSWRDLLQPMAWWPMLRQ